MKRFVRSLALACVAFAVAGCFPLAANYIHLEAPGVQHKLALCRDIGPPTRATWQAAGVRFQVALKPPFESQRPEGYIQVWARKDLVIRPSEPRGRVVRTDGGAPAEIAFGLERRDDVLAPNAIPVPPYGNVWHTYAFTGLPAIDFPGRLELPPMVVDGVTVPMPAFTFDVRGWAGFAPLNC